MNKLNKKKERAQSQAESRTRLKQQTKSTRRSSFYRKHYLQ